MMQNELLTQNLAAVGEEIGAELGAKMVKDFQDQNPIETKAYFIGRNIIEQILNQPGCVGIRFYNALNEAGQKTLVYVGIDSNENIISEYKVINDQGQLETVNAIVADRSKQWDTETSTTWSWFQ
ncbi:hypothetical protein KJS94_00480 [Flavihumibacter rivuli]|uniref:hypothetical protein n=1 Tax=Flavihumibacter rivuli TaxID=2838156 RepID=UPI001BDE32C8|nr:hypothetical protein [Flavihumibacter rivuli]ULQ56671.1 hypothetical protein KJS94_00480 [Flavihumibacter rivuli]